MTTPEDPPIPVVVCRRERLPGGTEVFVFDCPHCWRYGGSHGYDDVDSGGFYKRRPKRARPVEHVHSAEPGHRVAHCYPGSPYDETGYVLVERQEET